MFEKKKNYLHLGRKLLDHLIEMYVIQENLQFYSISFAILFSNDVAAPIILVKTFSAFNEITTKRVDKRLNVLSAKFIKELCTPRAYVQIGCWTLFFSLHQNKNY